LIVKSDQLCRAPHAVVLGILLDMVEDPLVGEPEGLLDPFEDLLLRKAFSMGKNLQSGIDKDPAGHFSCGLPTHAIGQGKETLLRLDGVGILIIQAFKPDIRLAKRVEVGHTDNIQKSHGI